MKLVPMHRVWTWMGAFDCKIAKPTVLYTTIPHSASRHLKRKKPPRQPTGAYYAKRGRFVYGCKKLKSTGAYTTAFSEAVADAFEEARVMAV